MIVSERPEGRVVVMQTDHQEQCAVMARAWGNATFARLPYWEDIILAAALHDEGWRRWEAAHPPDAGRLPPDFVDLPRRDHVSLYAEGIAIAAERSERAGLLVSMHGSGLYERRFGLGGTASPRHEQSPEVRRFLEEQEQGRERILAALEPDARAWAWAGYRLLQAWDALSLYLIWRALPAGREGELLAVPRSAEDGEGVPIAACPTGPRECTLEPWPFSEKEAILPVVAREFHVRSDGLGDAALHSYTLRPAAPR